MFGHFPKEVLSAFYASFDEDGSAAAPAPTAEDPAAGAAKTIASPTALPANKQRAVNALGKRILEPG
jgi:hypothetical protein